MTQADTARLVSEARRLNASARGHKRAEAHHRKAARSDREKQASIERQCAELGITVTYDHGEGTNPWPPNHSSTSRP